MIIDHAIKSTEDMLFLKEEELKKNQKKDSMLSKGICKCLRNDINVLNKELIKLKKLREKLLKEKRVA